MSDAERLMTYIIINAWNQKKVLDQFQGVVARFRFPCVVW